MKVLFNFSPYNQQRQCEKPVWIYPVYMAMYATYLYKQGHEITWGYSADPLKYDKIIYHDSDIDVEFKDLPYPDRRRFNAKCKIWQENGNYKYKPGTHMMVSNLCWYCGCEFCLDSINAKLHKRYVRPVRDVINEIDDCIRLGIREVFDDSGTFPIDNWLYEFCAYMLFRSKRIKISCNMRIIDLDWKMLKAAGFRMILFGIESANQKTLDKLNKGTRAEDIIRITKAASEAGLEPHGTFMTGYEWESEEDEKRTIELCHYLLRKGYLKTAQASVYSLPGTFAPLDSLGHRYLPLFYNVYKSPEFIIRKLKDIKSWEDFTYLFRGVRLIYQEKVRKHG